VRGENLDVTGQNAAIRERREAVEALLASLEAGSSGGGSGGDE